ncbi:MAG: signal peptidase II [Bacteroidia bacterium]|jgi:signal peptidase II
MMLGQDIEIFDWFIIHFTENIGMAFGMSFGGEWGKLFLTLFRITMVFGIIWYLLNLIKEKKKTGMVVAISFVLAGAVGNIIDSVLYGVIFNDSYGQLATLFPEEGGYSKVFHGRVVDMLYFPLIDGHFPSWFPIWANEHFLFFRPVFNIADSAICVGIGLVFVYHKDFFPNEKPVETVSSSDSNM